MGWAWEHQGAAWPSDTPIAVEVSDDAVGGLPAGYPKAAVEAAFVAWTDHDCLDVSAAAVTTATDAPGQAVDGRSVFTVNDPFDQVPAGSWAVTVLELSDEVLFRQEGTDYRRIVEADVVFSDTADFATDAAIGAACADEVSFAAVATREVGHLLGLADACARGGDCLDAAEQEATMHWLVAPCDTSRSTLAADDLAGLAALYGPYVPFQCEPESPVGDDVRVAGLVPLVATCAIEASAASVVDAVAWDFGDGGTAAGEQVGHTWQTAGRYDVEACVEAPSLEACSLFDPCPTRPGYVLACTPPAPSIGWDVVDGATIQLVNDTPIPAEGCFSTAVWTLYDGTGALLAAIEEWEPVYTFPGPGDYLAVFEVDGPAGYATAQTMPHVAGSGGADDTGASPPPICGCAAAPPLGAGAGWIALLVAATRRRGCRAASLG